MKKEAGNGCYVDDQECRPWELLVRTAPHDLDLLLAGGSSR